MLSLSIEKRDGKLSPANIRKTGKIPAVYYGPKEASTSIVISTKEFKDIWKKAGESSVVVLKEGSKEHEVLIHDVDIHPLSGEPRHADFYVLEKGKKVKVKVSLVFKGTSPAVKDKGAILVKVMRDMEIEAAPKDLPREIVVDISKLVEFNDTVKAKDVTLPAGVEIKVNPEEVLASVSEPKEEVVDAPTTIDMAAIGDSVTKGKEVKEGEAGAAPAADAPKKDEKKEAKK